MLFKENSLKRFEEQMRKYKPKLLEKWYEEQDEKIRKEYEDEIESLHADIFDLQRRLKTASSECSEYKHKYEAALETQEQLLNKVEKTSTDKGQLKQEVKQLKIEAKEQASEEK